MDVCIPAAAGNVNLGDVPASAVQKQITVMNNAYSAAGLQFRLVSISRTTSSDWFYSDLYNRCGI